MGIEDKRGGIRFSKLGGCRSHGCFTVREPRVGKTIVRIVNSDKLRRGQTQPIRPLSGLSGFALRQLDRSWSPPPDTVNRDQVTRERSAHQFRSIRAKPARHGCSGPADVIGGQLKLKNPKTGPQSASRGCLGWSHGLSRPTIPT